MIRVFLIALSIFGCLTGLRAGEFRKWTEAETERVIYAMIIDKKLDDSEARLSKRGGKSFWIAKDKLIEEDQKYIEEWVKPVKHITARVIASGNGGKKVEVTAVAGSKDMTVKAYWDGKKKQPKGYPKIYEVKKGEELKFTYKAGNKYTVKGFYGDEVVDEESWDSKTEF